MRPAIIGLPHGMAATRSAPPSVTRPGIGAETSLPRLKSATRFGAHRICACDGRATNVMRGTLCIPFIHFATKVVKPSPHPANGRALVHATASVVDPVASTAVRDETPSELRWMEDVVRPKSLDVHPPKSARTPCLYILLAKTMHDASAFNSP
jgi:hypothetical protein